MKFTFLPIDFIFLMFIYFEREIECKQGRDSERGRERIPSSLCTVSTELDMGLKLTNQEIMT